MKNPYIGISISVISVSFAAIIILFCDTSPLTISFHRLLFTTLLILPIIIFHIWAIIGKKISDEKTWIRISAWREFYRLECVAQKQFKVNNFHIGGVEKYLILLESKPRIIGDK